MCLQAIRCNIQAFCCNGLQGVTWSYMALQGHLGSYHVPAIVAMLETSVLT
jgi:hypothetical protein